MIYLADGLSTAPVTPRGNLALCEGVYDSEVSRGFRYLLPRVRDELFFMPILRGSCCVAVRDRLSIVLLALP